MTGLPADPPTCEAVRDELPEVALGTSSGRPRSEALDHTMVCARCSAELRQLSVVADELLQLAPQVEPPVGFEVRLAQRLAGAEVGRRSRRRHVAMLAAAAVVLVLLGGGVGASVARQRSDRQGPSAVAAPISVDLLAQGHKAGHVWVSTGQPAWMFVTVDGMPSSGTVRCVLTLTGGEVQTVGTFPLTGDYGAWGAPLGVDPRAVRSVHVVDAGGAVLAAADIAE